MPGPLRRIARNRTRLIALALVAMTPLAASAMQTSASLVLQQTLSDNWRGSYDLLVTARDRDPVTAGLLRPETLVDAATGGLTLADLALIRSLPGVDVAAPVTQVSFSTSSALSDPLVWVPVPVRPDSSLTRPQAFRVTVSGTVDDAAGERSLTPVSLLAFTYAPQPGEVVIGTVGLVLRSADGQIVYADGELANRPRLLSADAAVAFAAGNYDLDATAVPLGLYLSPRPAGVITLVDPVAERELLGASGAFLDPLIDAARADPDAAPILTLDRPGPPVRFVVTVEEFDSVVAAEGADDSTRPLGSQQYGGLAPRVALDASATLVASYSVEAAQALLPFTGEPIVLGSLDASAIGSFMTEYLAQTGSGPRSIAQARYLVPDDIVATGVGIELIPRGYAAGGQYVEAPLSRGAPLGAVTEYSKVFNSLAAKLTESQRRLEDRIRVVGGYTSQDLSAITSAAAYAPLGGYDVSPPSLVADPAGEPVSPAELATSLTGFGIPGTNTMAIGDIRMLEQLSVERAITSIRVRVLGIDDFTQESQQRLLDAVVGLRALGFTATIMAGSSPQTLPVTITGYASAALDDRGMQVIGSLGTIEQRWSRLGSVVEAHTGVTATSVALVALSTASAGAIFAAVQLGSVPVRRAAVGVMRAQGWRRRRIRRWFAAEEAIALVGLALASGVAVALATTPVVVAVSAAVAILLVLVTSTIAVFAGADPARIQHRRMSLPIRGAVTFGMRRARTNPAATLSLSLAIVLLCVIVAIGATILVEGRRAAGPSDLGALAALRAWLPQGILLAVGLVSTGMLARLSRRLRADRAREQRDLLTAAGWSRRARSIAEVAESAVAVVPAGMVGVAASVAMAAEISPSATGAVAVASTLAALGAFAVVIAADRRLD